MRPLRRDSEQELERLRRLAWNADTVAAEPDDSWETQVAVEQARLAAQITDLVRQHMRVRGYSQQDLAKALSLSEGRVSQILSGDHNLTLRTLAMLAAGLEMHWKIESNPDPDEAARLLRREQVAATRRELAARSAAADEERATEERVAGVAAGESRPAWR